MGEKEPFNDLKPMPSAWSVLKNKRLIERLISSFVSHSAFDEILTFFVRLKA